MTGVVRGLLGAFGSAVVSLLVVATMWWGFIDVLDLDPLVAKSPTDVIRFFVNSGAPGQPVAAVWTGLAQTLADAALGLVVGLLAAAGAAVAFVLSPVLERGLLPAAVTIRSVPLVAMTPLVTLVFGNGPTGTTVITAIVVFFPALVTMTFGLRSAPRQAAELCRAYGAGTWTTLRKVLLPGALPALFAAVRVAVPGSLVGAMLAEYLASGRGLGYGILRDAQQFSYDSLWASVTVLTLVSVLAYYLVAGLESLVLRRYSTTMPLR